MNWRVFIVSSLAAFLTIFAACALFLHVVGASPHTVGYSLQLFWIMLQFIFIGAPMILVGVVAASLFVGLICMYLFRNHTAASSGTILSRTVLYSLVATLVLLVVFLQVSLHQY